MSAKKPGNVFDVLNESVFQQVPTGALILDDSATILRANPAAIALLKLQNSGKPQSLEEPLNIPISQIWDAQNKKGEVIEFKDSPFLEVIKNESRIDRFQLNWKIGRKRKSLEVSCDLISIHENEKKNRYILVTLVDLEKELRTNRRLRAALELNKKINSFLMNLLEGTGKDSTLAQTMEGARDILNADAAVLVTYSEDKTVIEQISTNEMMQEAIESRGGIQIPMELPPGGAERKLHEIFDRGAGVLIRSFATYLPPEMDRLKSIAKNAIASSLVTQSKSTTGVIFFKLNGLFQSEQRRTLQMITPALAAALFKYRYEIELKQLATTDYLTGLANRRVCMQSLDQKIKSGQPLAVIQMDLDYFKNINDSYGHLAGDAVLQSFGQILLNLPDIQKNQGLAARTGGEEFMVLLYTNSTETMFDCANQIRSTTEKNKVSYNGKSINLTVSIGCTTYKEGESIDELYARVDRLLYKAKESGRNQIVSDIPILQS